MAGSWAHMTTKSGRLRDNESFCGMIENLGDAYEAAEECYGMIWVLAGNLASRSAPPGQLATRGQIMDIIADAAANYQDGLALGGVRRSR